MARLSKFDKGSRPILSPKEASIKAEAWCAYQERSEFEVRRKLLSWGINVDDSDVILTHLINEKFIDEQRFASAFASGKFRIKKWGKNKVRAQLYGKKVPKNLIAMALDEVDDDAYRTTLLELAEKKLAGMRETDKMKRKAKLMRFLVGKGYEMELVVGVVKKIGSAQLTVSGLNNRLPK